MSNLFNFKFVSCFLERRLDKIIDNVNPSDIVVWGNLSSNWCHYYFKKTIVIIQSLLLMIILQLLIS